MDVANARFRSEFTFNESKGRYLAKNSNPHNQKGPLSSEDLIRTPSPGLCVNARNARFSCCTHVRNVRDRLKEDNLGRTTGGLTYLTREHVGAVYGKLTIADSETSVAK